ncbi:MAG: YHS domain-containing (seleno)protein [Alphaproteobacteria bacterium]|nr:YHS domain-containing (seleno)protein [Alphaproteobacteria bacterium]
MLCFLGKLKFPACFFNLLISLQVAFAGEPDFYHEKAPLRGDRAYWSDSQTGAATGGYDVVAYMLEGKAKKGKSVYEYFWKGVSWNFVNEGNLAAFSENPFIYAPSYGGYDPVALSRGYLIRGNPLIWRIHERKLLLFQDQTSRFIWQERRRTIQQAAEPHWLKMQD